MNSTYLGGPLPLALARLRSGARLQHDRIQASQFTQLSNRDLDRLRELVVASDVGFSLLPVCRIICVASWLLIFLDFRLWT
jgi:hypothetical protein